METFGEKLRQAVESQGLPLDEVAKATGLGIESIRALERGDFGALPGDDIVTEGLRSLARLVGVDPDEVIADYLRERQRWLAAMPVELELVEDTESPRLSDEWLEVEPSKPGPGRTGRTAIAASAILALAVIAFWFWSRTSTTPESPRPAVAGQSPTRSGEPDATREAPGARSGVAVSAPDTVLRTPESTAPTPAVELPAGASGVSIPAHGVGRGIVQRELVGQDEQFTEGERVWFWTRIQGGTAGESIDHVWLHEGEEAVRVTLRLGGARWRTQSYKDLSPGSRGRWAVEARDETGNVLARREFRCSARP